MALASPSSAETLQLKLEKSDTEIPMITSIALPSLLSTADISSGSAPAAAAAPLESPNPNTNPNPPNPTPTVYSNSGAGLKATPALIIPPAPPAVPSFTPSFRPFVVLSTPQYTTVPNPSIQPPGVSAPIVSVNPMMPGTIYQAQLAYTANGYVSVPAPAPHAIPPPVLSYDFCRERLACPHEGYLRDYFGSPIFWLIVQLMILAMSVLHISCMLLFCGVPRYPGPYPAMIRPGLPLRPMPPFGAIPQVPRLPLPGVRPMAPMVTPMVRPIVPILAPAEKPQTTVYVGKIAPTVDNDFLLSLLRICGPVKSWKRAQDPSDGKPKGFGFCEFDAAEGVLRALRLLSRLNIDGQELVLNINQATREYLERYVEKKTEREKEKLKSEDASVEGHGGIPSEKEEPPKLTIDEAKRGTEESGEKGNQDIHKFGIVSDDDREADKDALEKITNMIEERLKTNPLPPPPPMPASTDEPAKSNSEVPSRSKDGDSDIDIMKSDAAEEKNDEETTSENKLAEHDKPEPSSPDRKRHDRRREKERERDIKREKERELERYERDRERERLRRERERELRMREAERLYKDRMKDWEAREREREYQRQYERDREKDRQRERRKEMLGDEAQSDEDDDDLRKRRRRSSMLEERRRKRLREKEEDLIDRLNEEEEIVEAKKRKAEEPKANKNPEPKLPEVIKEIENPVIKEEEMVVEGVEASSEQDQGAVYDTAGNGISRTSGSEMTAGSAAMPEMKQNDGPVRKLGFGLVGSGKRTTVLSVFHQEDDEDIDEKKMRPLVPIDYSNEELQSVKGNVSAAAPNIVAAAEFAKRISTSTKEEKNEIERERNVRLNDRASRRDRDRSEHEGTHSRSEIKEKMHDKVDKMKTENKKLLDAKQLIDMIPKTKEELFAYEINWSVYDKHALHERMKPWISKKITEFLGEEEPTLVDYIVSSTKEHVRASKMLELLQSILDDEAEMFVLKMWRMLIFEVKKVETGLSVKSKT